MKVIVYKEYMSYIDVMNSMIESINRRIKEKERIATDDEIWFLEHNHVYTQGMHGDSKHILKKTNVPIIQTDRGGQITYHGPGQLIAYFLCDLRKMSIGVKKFVNKIETSVYQTLKTYDIETCVRNDAHGLYINESKICSIGLRIKERYSYHGIALNISTDLSYFNNINPCGYRGMKMCNMIDMTRKYIELHEICNKITYFFNK